MVLLLYGYIVHGAKLLDLKFIQHHNNKTIKPYNNYPQLIFLL